MTCNKCGQENPNGARFCENCGGDMWKAPKKKGGFFKILFIIIIIAGLGVGGYFVYDTYFKKDENKNGEVLPKAEYEVLVDKYIEALNKEDVKQLLECVPQELRAEEDFADYIEYTKEEWEDVYGKDVQVSCEIVGKEKAEEEMLEDLQEYFFENYDVEVEVADGYELELEISAKDGDAMNEAITVAQIDGKWYVIGMF